MDVLLLTENDKTHYVLIRNLKSLTCRIKNPDVHLRSDRNFLCRNFFHMSSDKTSLENHQRTCLANEPLEISMPAENQKKLTFKNKAARSYCPFVCYFDLESVLEPTSYALNDPKKSSTTVIEKRRPSSFCLVFIEQDNPVPYFFSLRRGLDSMEKLVKLLEKLAEKFHKKKQKFPHFIGNRSHLDETENCWICEEAFATEDVKILDHCHFSGKFLGYAHTLCNLQRQRTKFTPIFAHNLANYDIHHAIRALKSGSENNTNSVIPINEEKYASLSLKVWIGSYTTNKGHVHDITLQKVLETEADSEVGYIVEVDIEYPQVLQEAHSDFPLAPTKEIIKEEWLSNDQRNFLIENDIPIKSKVKKLIQTMYPKKNYTLHYLTLQLYVQLGLKVTEVHRVLQFNQAKWLKPYIELNTEKRKRAQNKFEEDFYKLLSNSAYGKTSEGKRNRINV